MLTGIEIQNFKTFEHVSIELGQTTLFIGPNNSGKTTALQALSLWYAGLLKWSELRLRRNLREETGRDKEVTTVTSDGVVINRLDLNAIPVPNAQLLWKDLFVRNDSEVHIRINVTGVAESRKWECAFNFWYVNEESLTCLPGFRKQGAFYIPAEAEAVRIAFLPPMSGLAATEDRLERGSIQRRIGEGRTAEVLRNLCYQVYEGNDRTGHWDRLKRQVAGMFGVELLPPVYRGVTGVIDMAYLERGVALDLSSAGRGMLQILLLLSYLYVNPGAVLLLDEPDAHLEILRQREVYQLLTTVASAQSSQIIAASHSEVLLNEAADRDVVVAFVGQPHRIDDRSHVDQVRKSLKAVGFEQYYQAEQTGWVLYLEGATDLAILRAFAETLQHPAGQALESPFSHYVANQPSKAESHFRALLEAKPALVGFALFDRLDRELPAKGPLRYGMWQRREIENYLMMPAALLAYAREQYDNIGEQTMQATIEDYVPPIALRDPEHPWWRNTKASDEFLDLLFATFFERLELPNLMQKTDYHRLARFVPRDLIDPEITEKLDAIAETARTAKPRENRP